MGIELAIKITSPLTADDKELLSGVAVVVLAVANREQPKEPFSEAFQHEDAPEEPTVEAQANPCGVVSPGHESEVCGGNGGYRGRHRFRNRIPGTANELVN